MTNAPKHKHLGKNMKPRITNTLPQNEDVASSASAVQEDATLQANFEASIEAGNEGDQIPVSSNLETLQEPTVSSLESLLKESGPVVIGLPEGITPESTVGEVFGGPITITSPSITITGSTPSGDSWVEKEFKAGVQNLDSPPDWKKMPEISDEVLQRAHAIMAAHAAEQTPPLLVVARGAIDPKEWATAAGVHGARLSYSGPQMGALPSGEYRTTVRIPEGYLEGCIQTAEADNLTIEDWITLRFGEYLQNWFFAAGQK